MKKDYNYALRVDTTRRIYKGKTYTAVLLRRSFRENGKVTHETVSNLTHLPPEILDLVRRGLRGEALVPASGKMTIVRSLPHGHVAAVLGTLRKIGLETCLGSRGTRDRALMEALIVSRILSPGSKLACARELSGDTATSTLPEVLDLAGVTEDALYETLDRLLTRKDRIEASLAKKHLTNGTLVLYDVSSSYYTGTHCDLAHYGYNRDGKKRFPQIVYGLLCAPDGCPVAIEVFGGHVVDAKTLSSQIDRLRARFGLTRVVLVTDRGILTETNLETIRDVEGLDWITALRAPAIRRLREQGRIQPSLFDQKRLAEITAPEYPGERLIVCRNPVLAMERSRKREALLQATEKTLTKIAEATRREKRALSGQQKIALRVGRIIDKFKVAKHFLLEITDRSFSFHRDEDRIREEAALDGLYVIRTSVPETALTAEQTVLGYKSLTHVERAFRCLKTVDLEIRPIHHRLTDRVKAHVFLCMLAYYVEWHMKQALSPLLFSEDDRDAALAERPSVVDPSGPSPSAREKAATHRTKEGLPVHSFKTLLRDLGTLARNRVRIGNDLGHEITLPTTPTPLQKKIFLLLGLEDAC